MKRGVLPLNALRAFEAAARLGRMVDAAEELGGTHGAISRQIRGLDTEARWDHGTTSHQVWGLDTGAPRAHESPNPGTRHKSSTGHGSTVRRSVFERMTSV